MPALATAKFTPTRNGLEALLDKVYEVKFSRHMPLSVVLLSAIYAVYRSQHYLAAAFHMPWYVALPTALFLELLVLGASAATFIALRGEYVAQLKSEDVDLARWGVHIALVALVVAFVALLGVAWADAWLLTGEAMPALLMTLAQFTQGAFVVGFIVSALLDERAALRAEYADYERSKIALVVNTCPHCGREVTPNNRRRHIDACPARPLA